MIKLEIFYKLLLLLILLYIAIYLHSYVNHRTSQLNEIKTQISDVYEKKADRLDKIETHVSDIAKQLYIDLNE